MVTEFLPNVHAAASCIEHPAAAMALFDMVQPPSCVAEAATAEVVFAPCGQARAGQFFDAGQSHFRSAVTAVAFAACAEHVPPAETYAAVDASFEALLSLLGHEKATAAEAPTTTRARARDSNLFKRMLHLRRTAECLARPAGATCQEVRRATPPGQPGSDARGPVHGFFASRARPPAVGGAARPAVRRGLALSGDGF